MPWHIEKRGDEWCVIKDDDASSEGCHDSEEKAQRQMRALYANERALPDGVPEVVVRALPSLELGESNGDGRLGTIHGEMARYGQWTLIESEAEGRFMEQVSRSAFEAAIEGDKERYRLLFDHGMHPRSGRLPLGPLEWIREDDDAARYQGILLDTEFNRELLPGLKAGLYGSSFRGRLHHRIESYPERSDHNPDSLPEATVEKVRPLLDVGPTPFPAYMGTVTTARSLTDEFLMAKFAEGDGLQKFAAWAAEQANQKIQMPVKTPAPEPARSTPAEPPEATPTDEGKETAMAVDIDRFTSKETLAERRDEVEKKVKFIDQEYAGRALPTEKQQEWNELLDEKKQIDERIAHLTERESVVRSLEHKPESATPGVPPIVREDPKPAPFQTNGRRLPDNIYDVAAYRTVARSMEDLDSLYVDGAKRAIEVEDYPNPVLTREQAQTNIEKLLRTAKSNEDEGSAKTLVSRHILATGSDLYRRAFGKYVQHQTDAMLTAEEKHSLVSARALSLTGSAGGFAVPFELDPTILGTSNGTINFIRQIARVENITVDEWRGITSAGITAGYAAEATETTDNAPTLVQPTVSTEKAQAFVPFSIEIGMDWDGLQTAIAGALSDAKDELEAAKFVSGTGTNEPFGVLTGTTNTVAAAAGQTFTLANLYALLAALPPRYRSRGAFMGNLLVANRIRQFDTAGGAALWVTLGDDAPDRLLGRPFYEASDMADVATSVKFLLFGDFSRFLIVDRIGLSVDLIPHIVGTNHRPTGQRGIYAFWRNGSKVLDANAFRALLGTA